ncbi:thioredoxin 1 [Actinoplanes octamycinicus]|uniref:Thioredoxin n=1 Tax=Actinoplanes octamycinicus TaxID=135948 RepID=A0A7W7M521_9ACTN|nr:thioredoxin domain-containing protein [Actinoplanes octamycinicus]MBB4737253.1 thioredoxin 1 [Actinoplanes octamycinicus]GIE63724.1 thioredoxin [Actinoplanes octamycinicus]
MPDDALITITDATFDELVRQSRLPVVVDFWAQWCPPCGPMSRLLAELAPEFAGQLVIGTLDADENPVAARAHRVLAMPTLLFFRDGVVTGSIVGARPKSVLRSALAGAVTPYANR